MPESTDTYTSPEDLLPIGDAAKMLGVSIGTVRRWETDGHIVAVRTPGNQRRFRRSEVDRVRAGATTP